MTKLVETNRYQANSNFILREIGGEAVLVPLTDAGVLENSVLSLNDTCRFLWTLFQTPKTPMEAVLEAQKEYEGPREEIQQGVYKFIEDFLQYGLLQTV